MICANKGKVIFRITQLVVHFNELWKVNFLIFVTYMQVWRNGKLQFIKPVLWKLNKKRLLNTLCWITFEVSLLSDSNQRPRDYKSRALANWAKEANFSA